MPGDLIKVLLVDDDEDDYIITRDLISQAAERRCQLEWVSSYEAALTAIQSGAHDICLLDYRLGARTGLELLRESQSLNRRPPMILLTGQGDQEIDLAAMKAGAADYLVKGHLTADSLDRAIRYAIAGKRAEENLRRDRDLISRIMETSPVGVVMADRDGKITFANHRAEEVLSLAREAIDGGACSVLDWRVTDAEGNSPVGETESLKNVFETGQPVKDIRHAIERPNGRRKLFSTNATPLFDAAGKIDGMVVTVEDITERLALEGQLRQAQKMESVGQLAAGVAHDINNILTIIQGHTGLLLNSTPPNTDPARSLTQIFTASERAASFIRQLMMFSRKQVVQTKIIDLNSVLTNLDNMLASLLGEEIARETRYQDGLPAIEADTGMVEQIVMNLAVNARDAMPRGGKLSITTSAVEIDAAHLRQNPEAHAGKFVCLNITDNGYGMERWLLQRIFEPFFTTKEAGKGTGLGLATVYGIVRQHRGWIEVRSEVGTGTTFEVFLPAAVTESDKAVETSVKPAKIQGGKEIILLVEDEPGLRALSQRVLRQYDYNVFAASSGAEALRVWDEQSGRIDLLLTDMIMPGGMRGSELAAELKKRKPALKVIYSSGYSSELAGKDFGNGEVLFLAKPYLPDRLAQIVRNCLDAPNGKHTSPALRSDELTEAACGNL